MTASKGQDSPVPLSVAALRQAVLKGREPRPAAALARLASYRWLVVGTVCVGAFMGQLDSSIVQLVLPRLEVTFAARLSSVSWVAIAYLLTMAALLPIFGRLADMVGRKLLYTGGFLLFVVGSALCGLAPSLPVLIVMRSLQAIGASLLSANSVAIVVAAAGREQRGRALGIQAAAQAIGLSAGPMIGGLLLATLDWRWVFWINVPVGLAACVIGWLVIPPTEETDDDGAFDWRGAILLGPAVASLMAALNEAHSIGLKSPAILGFAVAGIALFAIFVNTERRSPAPLVDFRLFARGTFTSGNAAGMMSYAMLFGLFFLMPFIFIRVYHDTPLEAGLKLAILPLALGVVSPLSGALSDRLGARLLTVSGMFVCLCGLALVYVAADGSPSGLAWVSLGLALVGGGQGLFVSPNNNSIMAVAPAQSTGEAGGLMNVIRSIGMSLGVAASTALLSWRLEALTARDATTVGVPAGILLEASHDVIVLLCIFAAAAAVISLGRGRSRRD